MHTSDRSSPEARRRRQVLRCGGLTSRHSPRATLPRLLKTMLTSRVTSRPRRWQLPPSMRAWIPPRPELRPRTEPPSRPSQGEFQWRRHRRPSRSQRQRHGGSMRRRGAGRGGWLPRYVVDALIAGCRPGLIGASHREPTASSLEGFAVDSARGHLAVLFRKPTPRSARWPFRGGRLGGAGGHFVRILALAHAAAGLISEVGFARV